MERSRLIWVLQNTSYCTNENWKLRCGRRVEPNIIQIEDFQAFGSVIAPTQAFHKSQDASVVRSIMSTFRMYH